MLRISIVRVYPTCKRVGSFSRRANAGINKIRFQGRFRGRALPQGGYRLVIRAVGAERDAAAVPIVIARGKMPAGQLRKARSATVCSGPVADLGSEAGDLVTASSGSGDGSSGGVMASVRDRLGAPLTPVVTMVRKAKGVSHHLKAAGNEASESPLILTLVAFGLIALASALLGTLGVTHIVRSTGFRWRGLH